MLLLFWLSLIPFSTAWMGENHFAGAHGSLWHLAPYVRRWPITFFRLTNHRHQGREWTLARRWGQTSKAKFRLMLYAIAIVLAFVKPILSDAIYVLRGADVVGPRPTNRDDVRRAFLKSGWVATSAAMPVKPLTIETETLRPSRSAFMPRCRKLRAPDGFCD